jgi:hypothetical protein
MKTDELIHLLANDEEPNWPLRTTVAIAAVAGTVAAGTLFFAAIGFRPDIATAVESIRFLFKFVVTISLAATATAAAVRVAIPGAGIRSGGAALFFAPILLLCAVALELVVVPSGQWTRVLVGHNSRFCLTLIPLLSIGPLVCFLAALRHGAPSHAGRAGAVAGLAASGIAATFYAAHCNDDSPLFVATWYPISILAVTTTGYLIGRRLLRW